MSDEEEDSPLNLGKRNPLQLFYDYTLGTVFGMISSLILNGVFAGLPTVFSGIVWVLKIIFMALYYILFKIVPFLIQYVGIPMFILGAILGIMFLGGHMLFVVLFIVGMFFYIRGLFNIKLVSNVPKLSVNDMPKESNNEFKLK
jgi:4-hydroxybenzoate polyprenyltransferase